MQTMITARELAAALSVSLRTVRRMTAACEIPYVKIRGRVRFELAKVLAALGGVKVRGN
jgi:excisionase family DNA binding protein